MTKEVVVTPQSSRVALVLLSEVGASRLDAACYH